jgi:hypothetical protein
VKSVLVASLFMVGVSACTAKTPTTMSPVHEFDLVSWGALPGGTPMDLAPCLKGRYEGKAILLLSATDSKTCSVVGGKVGGHFMDGECTLLEGVDRCGKGFPLAVSGSRGVYKFVASKVVADEAERASLVQAIVRGRVVEAATDRWRKALNGVTYEVTIADALSWPELDGAPTLVRLRAKGEVTEGPWVAITNGAAGTMVGPFTMGAPTGFMLDGRSYLSIPAAGCYSCGGVFTEVHAVEGGKLRRILQSYANAN